MSKWSKRTSVALDEETYAISRRLGNFSEFVRECLRRWNAYETQTHVHPTETSKCFPRSKKGCCILCWPDGMPDHSDWLHFREMHKTHPSSSTQWIEDKAKILNKTEAFPIPQETTFKKSRESPSKGGVKAFLGRLLKRK